MADTFSLLFGLDCFECGDLSPLWSERFDVIIAADQRGDKSPHYTPPVPGRTVGHVCFEPGIDGHKLSTTSEALNEGSRRDNGDAFLHLILACGSHRSERPRLISLLRRRHR